MISVGYAEFPADGIALLRKESSDKISSLKKALPNTTTERERLSLVDLMFEFICLADISNSPNASGVLSMPYAKHFSVDRSARYVATGTTISSIDPYELVFMIRPAIDMERLLDGTYEKQDWTLPYHPVVKNDEYYRLWQEMHTLADMYLEAKNNPRLVVLPAPMANPIAYPTNVPLYKQNGEPNEAFFVQWNKNIYDRFAKKR